MRPELKRFQAIDTGAEELLRFRRAAWTWLAPPARVARARLLMQLAYVADADANAELAPPELDAWGREVRDRFGDVVTRPPTAEERARGEELREYGDRLAKEATRLAPVRGLDAAMADVHARARALRDAEEARARAERAVADLVYGDGERGAVLLGERHTVGPYRTATSRGATFACLDLRGAPIGARGEPHPWTVETRDNEWTASRAAALFVAAEGVEEALRAVERGERAQNGASHGKR